MLILLPPSEGKFAPSAGSKLRLAALSFAQELKPARSRAQESAELIGRYCRPAFEIYTGVLYQALDLTTLNSRAFKRAEREILIISALYGAIRINDLIPHYKSKMLAQIWREPLSMALAGLDESLVVDMRSSTYISAWVPRPENTVGIRIFTKVNGQRKVITHMSKKYRGVIARYLLQQRTTPTAPNELSALLKKKFSCTLVKPSGNKSWFIDVIV